MGRALPSYYPRARARAHDLGTTGIEPQGALAHALGLGLVGPAAAVRRLVGFDPACAVRPLPLALSVRLPPSAGSWALTPPAPYVGVGLAPKSKL